MVKITFMGAGSSIFAKNILGYTMLFDIFHKCEIALYDIYKNRLEESELLINTLNRNCNGNSKRLFQYIPLFLS